MSNKSRRPDEAEVDKLLFRYLAALDQGDIEAVEAVLATALDHPQLDQLIVEANREIHREAHLSPLEEEGRQVRSLLRRTIPSAFREEAGLLPVTVGEVASKLRLDLRLSDAERALGRRLVTDDRVVPPSMDRAVLDRLKGTIGNESEAFWRCFRDAAIMAWLGRGQQRTQLAATRAAMARARGPATSDEQLRWLAQVEASPRDPVESVRQVYATAGRDMVQAGPSIAPLDDLIANYPICHRQVPGLTYRKAAEVLAQQTGQVISVPERQSGDLAGFLFCSIEGGSLVGCILVNGDDRVERRRFSAAHELGHYIHHFLPLLSRKQVESDLGLFWEGLTYDSMDELPTGTIEKARSLPAVGPESLLLGGQRWETEANRFAAELLMPEEACRSALERLSRRFGVVTPVRLLASEFLVSQDAMRRRLTDLGLLDAASGRSWEG